MWVVILIFLMFLNVSFDASLNNTTFNLSNIDTKNLTNETLGKIVNKKIVDQLMNISNQIANKIAPYLHLSTNEFKLLQFYIFIIIIVFLSDLISKFGKIIILVLGIILAGLLYYNGNIFWSLIILFISGLFWIKK